MGFPEIPEIPDNPDNPVFRVFPGFSSPSPVGEGWGGASPSPRGGLGWGFYSQYFFSALTTPLVQVSMPWSISSDETSFITFSIGIPYLSTPLMSFA